MKIAVILAAGIGSRLRPLTLEKPKCMVRAAGIPIIEHQLAAYEQAGFDKVWIVAGFRVDAIRAWLVGSSYSSFATVIENTEFESTNNMYSLSLLQAQLVGTPFYLSNGDVVFDPTILEILAQANPDGSAIAVDTDLFNEESMKVTVDPQTGNISGIAKSFTQAEAHAVSIDLYRFSADASRHLFAVIDDYIAKRGERHQWTEVALDSLLHSKEHDFRVADIAGRRWVEVDNLQDLAQADLMFAPQRDAIAAAKAFVFDVDGTLTVGNRPVPGATEIVERLRKRARIFFCTNNSSRSHAEHLANLQKQGFVCNKDEILSSIDTTVAFLKKHKLKTAYVVGTDALQKELQAASIDTTSTDPAVVIVGFDTSLTFAKVARAAQLIAAGRPYILTHPDPACPTPDGPVPDAGALGAMLCAATNTEPLAVLGKPSPLMLGPLFSEHGLRPSETVMIGDRLMTDIRMAVDSGCLSVLVLSGITSRLDVEHASATPSLVVDSVAALGKIA